MGCAAWLSGLHRGLFYCLCLSDPRQSHRNVSKDGGSQSLCCFYSAHVLGSQLRSPEGAWPLWTRRGTKGACTSERAKLSVTGAGHTSLDKSSWPPGSDARLMTHLSAPTGEETLSKCIAYPPSSNESESKEPPLGSSGFSVLLSPHPGPRPHSEL